MEKINLVEQIKKLKKERKAIILSHNYQPPEVQGIADFVGDSLELSQKAAAATEAEVIIFCGVHFMAETAYILNPGKKIILPDPETGCPLANTITAKALLEELENYSNLAVVCYINSSAEVKAESDICCTSSNALKVVESLREHQILFVPDKNLANYVNSQTDKLVIPWEGSCPIHDKLITREEALKLKEEHPEAKFMAHPECRLEVLVLADRVCGTSGMLKYVKESSAKEFIVGTEAGMAYRLKKENPDKNFITFKESICPDMKCVTLEKILHSLETLNSCIVVPESVRLKAKRAVVRMLELS